MANKKIKQYTHEDKKRLNNPQVGLVTPQTDKDKEKKKYKYDPHLDPQLVWSGKSERTSFEIPTVSLHVHERIDPRTIIEKFIKKPTSEQISLFDQEEIPLREEIEFYKHEKDWVNRLITGDSLLVMNSLLEKEGMTEKVQMVYVDPPYGIKYGSNFQPFVDKRSVMDSKDEDLTTEPEMIKAFRDTWELGIHSYLSYLRDRILLSKKLLHESGSIFVQISEENMHHVKELLDEIFLPNNFVSIISITKTSGFGATLLPRENDFIIWYAKDKELVKYHQLFFKKDPIETGFTKVELPNGTIRNLTDDEKNNINKIPKGARLLTLGDLTKPGPGSRYDIKFKGKVFNPGGRWWGTSKEGMQSIINAGRVSISGETLYFKRYYSDFPYRNLTNIWTDTGGLSKKIYVVQTNKKIIARCMLMTTDPGDLIIDITSGSGTSAFVAEMLGRRWIACDTSRVANSLAKKRFLTSIFEYYSLEDEEKGVSSNFIYETAPHITQATIANNAPPSIEVLYDQPKIDTSKTRVTGPFTIEAVPSPVAKSFEESDVRESADSSISRKGETIRQEEWRDELLKTGIRGKSGQYIKFSRVEPLQGTKYVQAEAETIPEKKEITKKALIVFGPEHAPLEQRLVSLALDEAQNLRPKPDMVIFLAFQFDSEAAKDIDETKWPGITLLRAQMNADLFTDDLKKKKSSNDSFWLVGQPDVSLTVDDGKYLVEVKGFDYYNTKTGTVESGSPKNIAMWMLDEDYDGRSLYPAQVFFPMSGSKDGWKKLARNLKAEVDEELIEQLRGTKSLPFEAGEYKQIAVKIIDDRGIESLRIIKL